MTTRNRPSWATVVGIIGIVFGGFGLMNAVNTAVLPLMMEWQRSFMDSMISKVESQPGASGHDASAVFDAFFGPITTWFKVWSVVAGLLGLIVSAGYIYASISMLLMKRQAIRLFYVCSGAAIVLALARGVTAAFALRMMGLNVLMASTASIAIHIVLMLVVSSNNKRSMLLEP